MTQAPQATAEGGAAEAPPAGSPGRLPRSLLGLLTVVGLVGPLVLYLWMLAADSVNTIVSDQWDDVTVIRAGAHHLVPWGALWVQHNENRIFFPNLIVLVLAHTAHFDIRAEEGLSAAMLVATTGLLVSTHRRRAPGTPLLWYVPVVALALSVIQWENTLWGFQMAWYLVLLCLVGTLALLDRPGLGPWGLAVAAAVAVVGSFSSLQGLLIWAAGLVLLLRRGARGRQVAAWLATAAVTTVVYFHGYRSSMGTPKSHYVLQHPLEGVAFYFALLGDVVGVPSHFDERSFDPWVVLLGLVIVTLAVWAALRRGVSRPSGDPAAIGQALIVFGLLFAAVVTVGRAYFHYWGATQSRYTTFDLLVPIGTVLCLLPWRRGSADAPAEKTAARRRTGARGRPAAPREGTGADRLRPAWVGGILVTGVVALQLVAGASNGLTQAAENRGYQHQSQSVLVHLDRTPDGAAVFYLYPFRSAGFVRAQAATACRMRLSVFATTSEEGQPPGADCRTAFVTGG